VQHSLMHNRQEQLSLEEMCQTKKGQEHLSLFELL